MPNKVVIIGAGESGIGAALLAHKKGYEVLVSDNGEIRADRKKVLSSIGIKWEEKGHSDACLVNVDLVIKSPGIPNTIKLIQIYQSRSIEVISEIEFGYRNTESKIIGITGSNGKTTTATLTHHIFKNAGKDVSLVGNIGKSFCRQIAERDTEFYVVELSSFQLDDISTFKPDVAMILNITPDHLDRYENDLQLYADSKFRITMNQKENDAFIFNYDDPIISERLQKGEWPMRLFPISMNNTLSDLGNLGAGTNNKDLEINTLKETFQMSIQDLALQGKHNVFNSMASGVAARLFELRKEAVRDSLTNFENIEHRLETVTKVHGIRFINDSKATNVNSTWYALESLDTRIIWIAGGVDKGNDYSELLELVEEKVMAIICLGKDNEKLHKAFEGVVDEMIDVDNAEDAVRKAYDLAHKGDTVILSPACASFDLFENYEDRGHQFKKAVRGL